MLSFQFCAVKKSITNPSFNLTPRVLSLPWLKRSVVRCFSHKANDSDLPLRYIPKKHRDINQTQCPSSEDNTPNHPIRIRSISSNNGVVGHNTLNGIKRCQGSRIDDANGVNEDNRYGNKVVQRRCFKTRQEVFDYWNEPEEVVQELQILKRDGQSQRCKFNLENSYYDGVTNTEHVDVFEEDVEDMQLYNGIGEGKQESSKTCRTKQGAEKLAIELLAKRAFTGVELRKKLTAKNFPVNVVEAVVSNFHDRGLINDRLYAELFSRSRWKSSSWGPRRIKQVLLKKGVSADNVTKALKVVFEDGEDYDQTSSTRLSNSSLQQLYLQASKHWQRSQNVPQETRKARVIRWLQYRGFDWAVVSIILKKLESDYPP